MGPLLPPWSWWEKGEGPLGEGVSSDLGGRLAGLLITTKIVIVSKANIY